MIFVPNDFRISELITSNIDNRVLSVRLKGIPVVVGECNVLGLDVGLVECVDGDYSVGLVGEVTRCVVGIDDCRA